MNRKIALLALLLGMPLAASAGTVTWSNAGPIALGVGDSITLSINVNDLPGWSLIGGGVEFSFNSAVLSVTNVTVTAPNDFNAAPPVITAGNVTRVQFADFTDPPGTPLQLATVTFQAVGAGTSSSQLFELASTAFTSPFVGVDGNGDFGFPPLTFGTTSFNVTGAPPVPLPAAAWLLLSGLAAVGTRVRRKAVAA